MNLKRITTILTLAVIPVFAGLILVAVADQDHSGTFLPMTPSIILPGDNGSGALSILPADDSKMRIEYRRILFGRHRDKDKSLGQDKSTDKDKAKDMDKGASDTWTQRNEEMSPPAAPNSSRQLKEPTERDKNFNSSDQGSSVDRDSRSSDSFHYIWWSSKSKDRQDKDQSLIQDRDVGSDRDAVNRGAPDIDKSEQSSRQSHDNNNAADKSSSGGVQYILDDPSAGDNDMSEDVEESIDSADQSIIILAAVGVGRSAGSMGLGTGAAEPGASAGSNDYLGFRDPGSSNLDPAYRDDSGPAGPSDFDRNTSSWGTPGSSMDHGSLDNY